MRHLVALALCLAACDSARAPSAGPWCYTVTWWAGGRTMRSACAESRAACDSDREHAAEDHVAATVGPCVEAR